MKLKHVLTLSCLTALLTVPVMSFAEDTLCADIKEYVGRIPPSCVYNATSSSDSALTLTAAVVPVPGGGFAIPEAEMGVFAPLLEAAGLDLDLDKNWSYYPTLRMYYFSLSASSIADQEASIDVAESSLVTLKDFLTGLTYVQVATLENMGVAVVTGVAADVTTKNMTVAEFAKADPKSFKKVSIVLDKNKNQQFADAANPVAPGN